MQQELEIDEPLLLELQEMSARIRDASTYGLFQHVDIGRLLPETFSEVGHSGDLTLTILIDTILSNDINTLALTAQQIQVVLELLSALIQTNESIDRDDIESEPEAVINSVQLELELREKLARLAEHPEYDKIAHQTLGQFWQKDWLPAPFEEMLTIQQLQTMDLSVLFKKKMVSETRITCMVHALEAALNTIAEPHSQPLRTSTEAKADKRPPFQVEMFSENLEKQALIELVLRHYDDEVYQAVKAFLRGIIETIQLPILTTLSDTACVPPNLQRKILNQIQCHLPDCRVSHIQQMLQGPGVSLRTISSVLADNEADFDAVWGFTALAVARGLGAEPVEYKGFRTTNFWTVNPSLLAVVMESDARKRGKRVKDVELLDPILHSWCRSHEGELKPRKDKRKPLKSRRRT